MNKSEPQRFSRTETVPVIIPFESVFKNVLYLKFTTLNISLMILFLNTLITSQQRFRWNIKTQEIWLRLLNFQNLITFTNLNIPRHLKTVTKVGINLYMFLKKDIIKRILSKYEF